MSVSAKGKSRAHQEGSGTSAGSRETDPLLSANRISSSTHGRGPIVEDDSDGEDGDEQDPAQRRGRRRTASLLCFAFLTLLFTLILAAIALGITAANERESVELNIEEGVKFEGPTSVRIKPLVDAGEDGLLLEIDGRAGVDVKKALVWEDSSNSWARKVNMKVVRWMTQQLEVVSVRVGEISIVSSTGEHVADSASSNTERLVTILDSNPILLPLNYPSSSSSDIKMLDNTLRLPIQIPSVEALAKFLHRAWDSKSYQFDVELKKVLVVPGKMGGISRQVLRWIGPMEVETIVKSMSGKVPDIPAASNPASLVSLISYSLGSAPSPTPADPNATAVFITALANLTNPLASRQVFGGQFQDLDFGSPWRIPVQIFLPLVSNTTQAPKEVLLAKASTSPFKFGSKQKVVEIQIDGQLVRSIDEPDPSPRSILAVLAVASPSVDISSALSRFLERYLSGRNNTILIRYDPTFPRTPSTPSSDVSSTQATFTPVDDPIPPKFVADLLKTTTIPLSFPGSKESLELFRNLEIRNMKFKLSPSVAGYFAEDEGDFLCSGNVVGEINLPDFMAGMAEAVDVRSIWPDVFVYEGEPPSGAIDHGSDDESASASYPPSPTPLTAFGRLRPDQLIDATTTHFPANATHQSKTIISATFIDAPLYLLPNRGPVLRRLMAKLVFGGPDARARVGIKGITAATVDVGGLGSVNLDALPIAGAFWVSGRGIGGR